LPRLIATFNRSPWRSARIEPKLADTARIPSADQERLNAQVHSQTLLIRADASPAIGTGHVMRCLALAQGWADLGGRCIFAMARCTESVRARLELEGFEAVYLPVNPGSSKDALQTAAQAINNEACFLVVDGYNFGSRYQELIRSLGLQILFLDDNGHADHYYADLVLNQNIHARQELYPRKESYTQLLLGTQYALLRREFWKCRNWTREIPETARRILVTFGGSDPSNATCEVIRSLKILDNEDIQLRVVLGGSNNLHKSLSAIPRQPWVKIERNVQNMPKLMAWADVAISGAGTTVWELAFMGLPSLIMVVADNQKMAASELQKTGCFKLVDSRNFTKELVLLMSSKFLRSIYSNRCKNLVDGLGYQRVLSAMFEKMEENT
jgi:UDP-2,4-diacetamido-2,4,6-trideoxy-beta-L-altropyranose hydrolase